MTLLSIPLIAIAILASSPISDPAALPDELPESRTVARKTEVKEASPAGVRELIEAGEFPKALEKLRALISRTPDPGEAAPLRLLEARLLERIGKEWDAAQVYRDLLERPEVDAEARTELHALYVRRGQFRPADRLTEPADSVGAEPVGERAAELRAYSLTAQGRFVEAVAAVDGRTDAASEVLRGNALLALGRRTDARDAFIAALRAPAPREVLQAAHFGLAQVARLEGARAVRVQEDEKAGRLGPMSAAELDAALALRALGRVDEVRVKLGKFIRDWPGLAPTARLALARLDEEAGHSDSALEGLAAAVTGSFGDALALTRLGDLQERRGNPEAAVEAYRGALEVATAFPPARERLARLLAAQGRWDEIPPDTGPDTLTVVYDRLLDGDLPYHELVADRAGIPLTDPRRVLIALLQLRAGFPGGALGWTEGADADAGNLASLRAEALYAVQRTDEAEELWKAILERRESVLAREGLIRVAVGKEAKDEAVTGWEELSRRHPADARVQARLADAFDRAGWKAEAKKAWERALAAGWLTPDERRRARENEADLEDELEEQRETREES